MRLKNCIEYQQELTGVKIARVGADTIYANNENRRYCTENGITTCFVRKGPKPKDEDTGLSTARRIIGTLRSTAMVGMLVSVQNTLLYALRTENLLAKSK